MEKKEILLYFITICSFIALIYIFFGIVMKMSDTSNKQFKIVTGNAVFDLEDNFKIGDRINGNLLVNSINDDTYGILLLTKDNDPLMTKTFNLKDISKEMNSKQYVIKIEDLIEYSFEEKGSYELFFSVLDMNINIKKKFDVQ